MIDPMTEEVARARGAKIRGDRARRARDRRRLLAFPRVMVAASKVVAAYDARRGEAGDVEELRAAVLNAEEAG